MTAKLCIECYHVYSGDRRPNTLTWGAACTEYHKETPMRGRLIKAKVPERGAAVIGP